MDQKVSEIQARLRAAMSKAPTESDHARDIPFVAFEGVAGSSLRVDEVVRGVIADLKARGYRVANIRRYSINTVVKDEGGSAAPYAEAGSDATLLVTPGRTVLSESIDGEMSLDQMIDRLGTDYDIIIGEAFGYLPVPKFLVTNKVQEGFSLGIPNVIGYIADREAGAAIPRFSPGDPHALGDKIERDIIKPHVGWGAKRAEARAKAGEGHA